MQHRTRRIGVLIVATALALTACGKTDPAPQQSSTAPSSAITDPGRAAVIKPAAKTDDGDRPYAPGAEVVFGIDKDTKLGSNIGKLADVKATCWGTGKTLKVVVDGPKGWKGTITPTGYGAGSIRVENPSARYTAASLAGTEAAVNVIKGDVRAGLGENHRAVDGILIKTNNDVRVEFAAARSTATDSGPETFNRYFPLDWAPQGSAIDPRTNEGPSVKVAVFLNLSCGEE